MKKRSIIVVGLCFFLMSLVALNSYADEAYCVSKKYPRFLYILMSGDCLELTDGVMVKGRNIGLEEYDLYNGCLIKLGLTSPSASLSGQKESELNQCLEDVGSSFAEASSDTSGSDR